MEGAAVAPDLTVFSAAISACASDAQWAPALGLT